MTNKKRNSEKKMIQANISLIESKLEALTNSAAGAYGFLVVQLLTQACWWLPLTGTNPMLMSYC